MGGMSVDTHGRLRALFREGGHDQIVAVAHEAARAGSSRPLQDELSGALHDALAAAGITALHGHQRAAYDLLEAGENVVVATGTASGKSLCYQVATLDALLRDDGATALYIFPTKALAQDQLAACERWRAPRSCPPRLSRRSTATRRRTCGPASGGRPASCSRTRTCCTWACCPTMRSGRASCTG